MTLCCPMNSLAFVLCVPWLVFNSNILSLNFIKAVPYFWNSCSIFLKVLLYGLIFNNVPLSEFLLKRQTSCLTAPLWGLKVPVVQVLTHTRQVLFFVPLVNTCGLTNCMEENTCTRDSVRYQASHSLFFSWPKSIYYFKWTLFSTKDSEGRAHLLPRHLNWNLSRKALVWHLWCSEQPWWGRETSATRKHRLRMSPFRISVTRTPHTHTHTQPYYKSSTIPENTTFEELQKFDDYSYKIIEIRLWDRKN